MSDEGYVWEGDDYADEPLPIVGAIRKLARRKRRRVPKGNTKLAEAPEKRRQVLREATGRAQKEPEQWRQELALGNREAAAATLTSKEPTHNSRSGFGLA